MKFLLRSLAAMAFAVMAVYWINALFGLPGLRRVPLPPINVRARADIEQLGTALKMYQATTHDFPTTEQGLLVTAVLTETKYQTKIKISDEQMATLNLTRHDTLPQWNYTIQPTSA